MACYQYQNNGSCKFGENCRFSHGDGGEGGGEDAYGQGRPAYRPQGGMGGGGGRPRGSCYTFQESGECSYGDRCRFAHGENDQRKQEPAYGNAGGFQGGYNNRAAPRSRGTCFSFRDGGSCQYGDDCRFSHSPDGGDNAGAGGRKVGGGICYKFRDEGFCQYGDDCRFSHEAAGAEQQPDGQPAVVQQQQPEEVVQQPAE